jgi:threonine/homoserine/homoserine lactone efflux protein
VTGLAWFISATAFALSMSATPGPNNAMVAASGANFGFRRTLPHMLGVSAGFPAMLILVALGAGEALRTWPWVHDVLRWAGGGYLLFLAGKIATARPDVRDQARGGRPLGFVQAALFQWVNPKAWVIAAGAVVTYTTRDVWVQSAVLAAIFLVMCLACLAFWTGVGAGAARLLRSAAALRRFNWAMAALLVASLVPLVME